VQPVVGVLADESTSKFGRRRPIIAIGSIIVALGLLSLGFTKEIVASFVEDEASVNTATIVAAVLSLYATDFAINAGELHRPPPAWHQNSILTASAVMSCSRSLVVDTLPITKQQTGASWSKCSQCCLHSSTIF
jgi:solute carrier family 45, member 1/2/4